MSNTETATEPTAWFLAINHNRPTGYSAAARWYWPEGGTTVEVFKPSVGDWIENDTGLFESLQENPTWQASTREEVEAWLEAIGSEQ